MKSAPVSAIGFKFVPARSGWSWTVAGLALLTAALPAAAQLTTRDDAVGRLLNEWHAKGQAAGLAKITYENRDGGHSPLKTAEYPQLQIFKPDDKTGNPKGPAEMLRPAPTVGNCSMAAPAVKGGSLPRFYQMSPKGAQFLMLQYLSNQMFVYPEHQDYDIGANGVGGYGDLYPLNNAATLISQGSSGSDLPFVNAVLATIAALPPETQDLLIQKRILMPTVQTILRGSNRMVTKEEDYYSGAAHPPVFDAAQLNEEKMVLTAHDMTPAKIPPLVQLQVLKETSFEAGRNFFEAADVLPGDLAGTPVSIARIMRGNAAEYEMTVSAAKTADLMRRPLQIRWQLLQGSPGAVQIIPSESGTEARLRVRWQPPVTAATGIRSHRADIGVFATNGISVSAPAFISLYHLPNEMRFYDDKGRVAEVYYRAHNPDLGLPATLDDLRWLKLFRAVALPGEGLRSRLLQRLLSAEERSAVHAIWLPLDEKEQALPDLGRKDAGEARAKLGSAIAAALKTTLPGARDLTLRQTLEATLTGVSEFADLYSSFQTELDKLATLSPKTTATADVRAEVVRLIDLGVLIEQASGSVVTVSSASALSAAERYYLSGLNLTLLSHVLFPEALDRSTAPAWVDPRLTTPKAWRDIYRYEEKSGTLLGWARHGGGRSALFDADGRFLPQGFKQPEAAQPVVYERNAKGLLEWRVK